MPKPPEIHDGRPPAPLLWNPLSRAFAAVLKALGGEPPASVERPAKTPEGEWSLPMPNTEIAACFKMPWRKCRKWLEGQGHRKEVNRQTSKVRLDVHDGATRSRFKKWDPAPKLRPTQANSGQLSK